MNSYLVPLFGAVAFLAMAGCSDDEVIQQENNRPQGKGIVFGASASYIGDGSRTAYGNYNKPNNPSSQELLWESNDRVEVYSPQSPTKQQVEYQIGGIKEGELLGEAYLAAYEGQDGLQWANAGETQDFYAIYPSPASITNQGMVQEHKIRLENGVLHGFIPTNQEYRFTRNAKADGGWSCTPTMDWQYMVARIDDFAVPTDGTDGGITLNFNPLVTTLEITLQGPSVPLAQMNIETDNANDIIMGKFSCNLMGNTWNDNLPKCTAEQTGTTTNYVTINLYDTDNQPITLKEGEYLTINVFLLPTQDWRNLQVRLAGYNTASRTVQLDYNNEPITLSPHKKTRVTLKAPNEISGPNQWMGGLNDNVYISQLSIPGTANTFSYEYTGSNPDWYKAQTANFEKQWNSGIRCFELKCPETTGDLGDVVLQCNRTNLGSFTFEEAVNLIWNKVNGSSEFAMIIPAYESNTGHPSDGNGVRNFANALNTFFRNHTEYDYITYNPELTLGEARGHLMFVARITSEEDENVINDIIPEEGVFIKGWGSLKDLWNRRGYDYPNWATSGNLRKCIENEILNGNQDYSFSMPGKGETNYYHGTIRSDGSSSDQGAYIQDWNRVSPSNHNYPIEEGGWFTSSVYAYWPESFKEKCEDVWNTFMAAIDDNHNKLGEAFYINSLDGYYIDESIRESYTPYIESRYGLGGTAGNIAGFAEDINNDFFQRIQSFGVTNIYGPMNVVLLDRVYQYADGTDSGSRLPSTIINNNFRFPLMVKGSGATNDPSTQNAADASYASGGSVWK